MAGGARSASSVRVCARAHQDPTPRGGTSCSGSSARRRGSGKSLRMWQPRVSSRAKAGFDHQPAGGEHVLQFPAGRVGKLPRQHVAAPVVDVLQGLAAGRRASRRTPDVAPHEALERVADVGQVQAARCRARPAGFSSGTARIRVVQLGGGRRGALAGMDAEDQRLEQAVRGQPVRPVQAGRGHFARRPEARAASCGPRGRPSRRRSCNGPRAGRECGRG